MKKLYTQLQYRETVVMLGFIVWRAGSCVVVSQVHGSEDHTPGGDAPPDSNNHGHNNGTYTYKSSDWSSRLSLLLGSNSGETFENLGVCPPWLGERQGEAPG